MSNTVTEADILATREAIQVLEETISLSKKALKSERTLLKEQEQKLQSQLTQAL